MSTLSDKVRSFCEARDWDQFHSPKDLAIGLSIEASELLEHFRFQSEEQARVILSDAKKREEIGQELADVLFFLIRFSQKYNFDLAECFEKKMAINEKKYSVEKAKGKNQKYNEL